MFNCIGFQPKSAEMFMDKVMNLEEKKQQKLLKAQAKQVKEEAKAKAKAVKAEGKLRAQQLQKGALNPSDNDIAPHRISIDVHEKGEHYKLVINGIKQEQLQRLLPQINRDILIAQVHEQSAFKAGLLRFFREGTFQTLIKVIAGLLVGLLMYKFGLN